jgi:PAS domain S-box-containing protein
MTQRAKYKEQLATEVAQLRQRVAELEAAGIERKRAEEALRKSEEKYRTVVDISPDGIAISAKGRHVFVNQSLARMFGVSSPDELVGRPIMDYIHPDYRKIVKERIEKQTKRGASVPLIEEKMIRADGTVIDTEVAAAPLEYQGEQAVLAVIRDITDRKRIEDALRESEERFRAIFEGAPDAIFLADPESGEIIDLNPAASQLLLRPHEEIVGLHHVNLHPPELQDHEKKNFIKYVRDVRAKKQTHPIESTVIRSDGRTVPVEILAQMIHIKGRPVFQGTFRDIAERKRIAEALRKSEERYRSVVDNIDLGINLIDADHTIIMVNATMGDRFNKPVSEIIGKKCFREFEKRDAVCPHCPGVQTMAAGKHGEVETEGVLDDGSRFHVRLQTFPVVGQGGTATAFIEIAEDITERKRMEEALRESEGKYRSLVESSEDSIYLVDEECTYLFMNKKHLARLRVPSSQVVGRAYAEFHSPEETKDFARKVTRVLKTGKSLSYEYRSLRDHRYFIRTLNPVKASKGDKPSTITVISKDITELKYSEEALREREAFNFALFQYNPVETIVVDFEGRVTGFNLAKGKSGNRLPVIGDMMYQDYAGKHEIDMRAELMKCIKSGKAKAFSERKYGDRYLSITISPFSQGALIISEDFTDRKRAEELLQRERDTFFSILQKAPYGVVFLDKEGKSILANTEFAAITGYTREDIPTIEDWFRLAYPDKKNREMVIDTLKTDAAHGDDDKKFHKTFHRAFFRTFRVTCKDGTIKEIEFRPTVLEDGATIVMIADITERKRMHELLEVAVTEWRTTFDAITDAVCLLDQKGRIKRCNNAMMKMIGKPFNEIADCTCWEVLHGVSKPPEGCPIASVQETHRRETEVFLKNNRWLNITVDPLLDDEGNFVGGVHITSDITERMKTEQELQSSREELRNLTVYLESVREQERTNIAREIHDELAQALTALKMDLSWLDNKLPRNQMPLVAKMRSMSDLIDTTLQTVKRISAELRPGILDDLGLIAAIEWQAEEFQNRTGITSRVTVDPVDFIVDKDRSTAIFRIFQETLTNIARHAHATRVTVDLIKTDGALMLLVIDNGTGITKEQIYDSKSFGLIGMRERVHPWGGQVRIKGTPSEGTTVEVEVPVGKE